MYLLLNSSYQPYLINYYVKLFFKKYFSCIMSIGLSTWLRYIIQTTTTKKKFYLVAICEQRNWLGIPLYLRDISVHRVTVCPHLVVSFVVLHITWEHIHLNPFNIHDPLTSLSKRAKAFDSNLKNLINNVLIISTIDLIQKCFQFIHHFYNQRWLHYFTIFYLNKTPWAENIKLFLLNAPCNNLIYF